MREVFRPLAALALTVPRAALINTAGRGEGGRGDADARAGGGGGGGERERQWPRTTNTASKKIKKTRACTPRARSHGEPVLEGIPRAARGIKSLRWAFCFPANLSDALARA